MYSTMTNILLVILVLPYTRVLGTSVNISLDCRDAAELPTFPMLQYHTNQEIEVLKIEDCTNLHFDLTTVFLPNISTIHLVNMTNFTMSINSESLVNVGELIVRNSNFVRDFVFDARNKVNILLENCVFEEKVSLHLIEDQPEKQAIVIDGNKNSSTQNIANDTAKS